MQHQLTLGLCECGCGLRTRGAGHGIAGGRVSVPPEETRCSAKLLEKRCAQCGRIGTRGFKTLGPVVHEPTGCTTEAIIVCAASKACQKRWPKAVHDIYEEW